MKRLPLFLLISLVISLACSSFIYSLSQGSISVFSDNFSVIFFHLRLPRTLSAFVCGALLALSGSLMQLLLQNPLADPYALGISGGAALMTLIMMLFGISGSWLIGGAWLGSLITIAFILLINYQQRFQTHALLLTGIALACGFSACISFILLISPQTTLHNMLFWLSGDLNGASMPTLACWILFVGFVMCYWLAPGFNLIGRGEQEARALGLSSEKYQFALFLLSSLFTAAAVTLAGCIGFIGLMVPHVTRLFKHDDHRILLPVSALLGGALLTFADTFARTLFAPQQIPVGILIALLGVPCFVWLLRKTS